MSEAVRFEPRSETEIVDLVRHARAAATPLTIEGGGTRSGLGRPTAPGPVVSTRGLDGITLYEPAEMVVSARAGTPLARVEQTLAERGQRLAFEPMDHRILYGTRPETGEPTIGAIAACNISGPRRVHAGAARDHLIGVRFVNGRGEILRAGGRVMKNVTGLDLVKLACGAHGTLGILTEVTFKVTPIPEASGTLVLRCLDDRAAITALTTALGSPFEVSGAAHLPATILQGGARTFVRVEHFSESVDYRLGRLTQLLAPFGAAERLGEAEAEALWRDIADARALANPPDKAVWRLSLPPMRAPGVVAELAAALDISAFYDWGGGLVWMAMEAGEDAGASLVHAASARAGGHAMLVRASAELRAEVPVFQPPTEAVAKLTAGIKTSFDPEHILNRGRIYAGDYTKTG